MSKSLPAAIGLSENAKSTYQGNPEIYIGKTRCRLLNLPAERYTPAL
jgi:hypothetical protein